MRADPDPGRIVGDARLLVVGGHPSGAQPELDPALGEQVEGGDLLGQHDRVPVVVAEDQRSDPQGGGGLGRHGQGHQRPELVLEVVGDEQGRVPEVFDACGPVRHAAPAGSVGQLDGEAERLHRSEPRSERLYAVEVVIPSAPTTHPSGDWAPDTWRSRPAAQQPVWPDERELKRVHAR